MRKEGVIIVTFPAKSEIYEILNTSWWDKNL